MRTGIASSPLHYGKAPRWLFERMKKLSRGIAITMISEYGPDYLLDRLGDPFWFQAFGCVLGFDWHSSGLTTTVCGALKEGMRGVEHEFGFYVAGGKGGTSRKTPDEIERFCERLAVDPEPFRYASRMSAKVDSAALQDGFELYHHNFFFTKSKRWGVIQQGMNGATRFARRYHWLDSKTSDFVREPHAAICSDAQGYALNMVAEESSASRRASTWIACHQPADAVQALTQVDSLVLPRRHEIRLLADIDPKRLYRILMRTYEQKPKDFEALLSLEGVGAKTIRALSLIGELIYGAKPSFRDPARFSFAHGGKDGHPYPVNRRVYDQSIEFLKKSVERIKVEPSERTKAFERLHQFYEVRDSS